MTRKQIEQDYQIKNGIIRSPGQFEGEMLYVPYFWEACFADENDGEVLYFEVSDEDRAMFPELANVKTVKLRQRDDGFVCEV